MFSLEAIHHPFSSFSSFRTGLILYNRKQPDDGEMSEFSKIASSAAMRKVIMSVDEDDEISDIENFQDIRMELNATGHNLVSLNVILL